VKKFFETIGELSMFAWRALYRAFIPPFEFEMILNQLDEVGWQSLSLILASGFAVGLVLTIHTRSSLVRFGAEAMIPAVQSLGFFNEIGPLVAALLIAGRVGSGIGAEANKSMPSKPSR
jgi:phospholipid/cholesterol/gamma-HCH transport system permease protein